MGIQGLLPFLKKIHQPVNVSQFSGCTVAIDAYCWLHKGAFSCAEKLALGEKTDQYVYYCMKYINNLLSKGIKPIMVLDGCHLPSKKNVEKTRREKRDLNRKKAAQFLREGKRAEARECLQRCIDVSPEMALELMNACRERGVDCIVAPYEADAQLAYLNKIGIAQVIITEDSDLLLFGCERVIFKMDHAGNGVLIEQRRLNEVTDIQSGYFTFDKFRYMCILSGCDYLQSLTGIGLVKANKVFKIARQGDIELLLKKLSTYLKTNITVPQEYIDGFVAANNTFLYQLVFDPLQRKLVPLNPYGVDVEPEKMTYAGSYMPTQKALQIALGNINIYTGKKFADFDPDTFVPKYAKKKPPDMLHMLSMWHKSYRVKPRTAFHEAQMPERPNLKGKEVSVKTSIKKRSPRKRIREADDSVDVRSNTELSDLYGDESPVKKKVRSEVVDDDLHRFMFSAGQESDVGSQSDGDLETPYQPEQTGPLENPKFFNSLSSAHPELICTSPSKEDNKENDVKIHTRNNDVKIHTRNIFAHKSPGEKAKFNLNAEKPKPVKSRFFSSSISVKVETNSSTEGADHKHTSSLGDFKPVHTNTANVYSNSRNDDVISSVETEGLTIGMGNVNQGIKETVIKHAKSSDSFLDNCGDFSPPSSRHFKFSKDQKSKTPKPSPSNSAFNWSKFKFNRQNSSEAGSSSPNVSQRVKQPFKKVMSEKKLDTFLKGESLSKSGSNLTVVKSESNSDAIEQALNDGVSSPCENSANSATLIIADDKSESPENDSETGTENHQTTEASSFPYSIDSMCLSQSDLAEVDSQPSLPALSEDCAIDVEHGERLSIKRVPSLSLFFKSNSQKSLECQSQDENVESVDPTTTDSVTAPEVVFLIESDDDDDDEGNKIPRSKAEDNGKAGTVSSKGKSKSGCRVSGLSRKSKKASSTPTVSKNQHNLKDMFAKFAHNKSDKPHLSHAAVDTDAWTPQGNSQSETRTGTVQRKILS